MSCFNPILKKDEAIKALNSSSGVEEALVGLAQSLKDSRQKYDDDKVIWEKKLTSTEQEKAQVIEVSKGLEKK